MSTSIPNPQQNNPEWSEDSAALFRKYAYSEAGQLFLAQVAGGRPALISHSKDVNEVALRACEAAGYERCVTLIFSLLKGPDKVARESENFPSLDNDEEWPEHLRPQPEPPVKAK